MRYYVAWSERAIEAARGNDAYREIGPAGPWTVFELPESHLVDIAEYQPVVYDGSLSDEDWAVEWYGYEDVTELDLWVTADGPEAWRRVDEVADRLRAPRPYDATGAEVTDVVIDDHDHRISFTTTAVGVPHLVKVSYFPNWTASGADGPYRVAPSLMVVVPTEENVVLQFERKSAEIFGMALTIGSLLGLAGWVVRRRRAGSAA